MNHSLNAIKLEILKNFERQADFAERLGIHESKVSQVLRGRRKLDIEAAERWASVLGCDVSLLGPVTRV